MLLITNEFANFTSTLKNIADETKRYALLMAWLNSRLEALRIGRIIITGGFAVELYTGRVYRTMDVDIICDGAKCHEVVEKVS